MNGHNRYLNSLISTPLWSYKNLSPRTETDKTALPFCFRFPYGAEAQRDIPGILSPSRRRGRHRCRTGTRHRQQLYGPTHPGHVLLLHASPDHIGCRILYA